MLTIDDPFHDALDFAVMQGFAATARYQEALEAYESDYSTDSSVSTDPSDESLSDASESSMSN
jgi:hypothetical protein